MCVCVCVEREREREGEREWSERDRRRTEAREGGVSEDHSFLAPSSAVERHEDAILVHRIPINPYQYVTFGYGSGLCGCAVSDDVQDLSRGLCLRV